MTHVTDDPDFQEWLEVTLSSFPAPSPEIAGRLTGALDPDGAGLTTPVEADGE